VKRIDYANKGGSRVPMKLKYPIKTHLLENLQVLCSIGAPSGHEDLLVSLIFDYLTSRGLTPEIDRLGQMSVTLVGSDPKANTTLMSAHLDQLGLVISNVRSDGFIKFVRLGGVPERALPGTIINIHCRSGNIPAAVGLKSHHLTSPEEKYLVPTVSEMYLDVGASSAEEVFKLGITVGDPCSYSFHWNSLANDRFSTVSLDDRLGVLALLVLIDQLFGQERRDTLHIAFTTQEEFHVRGTLALIAKYNPDIVINLDIAPAADTPDLAGATAVCLGGGPVINRLSFHGRGTLGGLIPHPALLEAAEEAAKIACKKYQFEVIIGLINDGAFVPMASQNGIATIGLSIPVRYTHSPIETGQLSDLEDTINLLNQLASSLAYLNLSRDPL
jgi:putative aminopeptidase FrvX